MSLENLISSLQSRRIIIDQISDWTDTRTRGTRPPGRWRVFLYHRDHPHTVSGIGWGNDIATALLQAETTLANAIARAKPSEITLADLDLNF